MRPPPVSTWVLLGMGGGIAAVTYQKLQRTRHARAAKLAEPARAARLDHARDRARSRALDREPTVIPDSYAIDPADPVQGIDQVEQFHLEDLEVDALSAAEVEVEAPTLDMLEMDADDRAALDEGQNWLEALEASAIETGAAPDRDLADLVDDEAGDDPPLTTDARDIPVADRGSGGPGGI